jgi:hypothetical protein
MALSGTRRLGREPVFVFGGGVMDFLSGRNQQPWTFPLFIFVLISPTILYQVYRSFSARVFFG